MAVSANQATFVPAGFRVTGMSQSNPVAPFYAGDARHGMEGAANIKEVSVRDDHIPVEGGGPCVQARPHCMAAASMKAPTTMTCAWCGKPVSTIRDVRDLVVERMNLTRHQPNPPTSTTRPPDKCQIPVGPNPPSAAGPQP